MIMLAPIMKILRRILEFLQEDYSIFRLINYKMCRIGSNFKRTFLAKFARIRGPQKIELFFGEEEQLRSVATLIASKACNSGSEANCDEAKKPANLHIERLKWTILRNILGARGDR